MMTFSLEHKTYLYYTCAGNGPDVLLIHGWSSSGRMWTRLSDALRNKARLWSVDLYGFGASPRPERGQPPDIDQHTAMLIDFCEAHGIRPKVIIGHSMGGMLALKLALARPDLMEQLVLMSPVVTGRFGHPLEINKALSTDWGQYALARAKPFWLLTQNILAPLLDIPWFMDREVAARIRQDYQRADWLAASQALASIARENLGPHLPTISHPALVIIGGLDSTVPPDEGRLAARMLPKGRLLELPKVGHQPLDEAPQSVIQGVDDFIGTATSSRHL
jgi:pimeloyl-ACP methyl ester carboxylesterase